MLEKTLESSFNSKVIKPVHPSGNQSWILIEGLVLMLKLQYFGHLIQIIDSLEKTLMLVKIEGRRRRGWQRRILFDGITDLMDEFEQLREIVKDREAWPAEVHGVSGVRHNLAAEQQPHLVYFSGTPASTSIKSGLLPPASRHGAGAHGGPTSSVHFSKLFFVCLLLRD